MGGLSEKLVPSLLHESPSPPPKKKENTPNREKNKNKYGIRLSPASVSELHISSLPFPQTRKGMASIDRQMNTRHFLGSSATCNSST